ncbi:hypothetical protein DPEC_G00137770 [Dallia pectoralis]|uniref:Uncharacterized protein n=1 Tax=Dallia pectoralis TaxID=75939 RepID=A0ACC2GM23_DALPE|nr:hypothetical protein DPEC_G00137770 [Dallia pectoralis]
MRSHTVIGIVGKSILLPCQLNLSISVDLETLKLFWTNANNQVVYVFYYGEENNSQQLPFYRNRTQMFLDQLSSGIFSLLLNDLKTDDDQKTFYLFHQQDDKNGRTLIQNKKMCITDLKVAKRFQTPVVKVNYEDRKAECSSTGGYPEPTLTWTNQNGLMDQDVTQIIRNPSGTFNISSTVNITENQTVMCVIYNPTLKETLRSTQQTMPDSNPSNNLSVIGAVIGAVIGTVIFGALIVFYLRRHKLFCFSQAELNPPQQQTEMEELNPPTVTVRAQTPPLVMKTLNCVDGVF